MQQYVDFACLDRGRESVAHFKLAHPGLCHDKTHGKKLIFPYVAAGVDGEPDEIAKAATILASDDSSLITGIESFIDGDMAQI